MYSKEKATWHILLFTKNSDCTQKHIHQRKPMMPDINKSINQVEHVSGSRSKRSYTNALTSWHIQKERTLSYDASSENMIFPSRNSHKTSSGGRTDAVCQKSIPLWHSDDVHFDVFISERRSWSPPTDRTNKNPTAHIWISSAELKTDNYHSLQSEILKHNDELQRSPPDSSKVWDGSEILHADLSNTGLCCKILLTVYTQPFKRFVFVWKQIWHFYSVRMQVTVKA